jgi:hypothetical protein
MPNAKNTKPKVRTSAAGVHYRTTADIIQSEKGRRRIRKMYALFPPKNRDKKGSDERRTRSER